MYRYEPKLGPRYWLILTTLTLSLLSFLSASASYDPRQTKRGLNSSSTAPANTVYVYTNGDVGVGLDPSQTEAAAKLHLNGTLLIEGGNPGTNKVLRSDANGLASWVGSASIFSLADDPSPELSADLDVNGQSIISTSGNVVLDAVAGGVVVVNEDGGDSDFRVESDGDANMIFVDAGNNRVGIGTSSPATTLDVDGSVTVASSLTLASGSITAAGGQISFGSNNLLTTGTVNADDLFANGVELDSIASRQDTSITVDLDNDPGDDFAINGSYFVVEGDTGYVGVNTDAPTEEFQVNGDALITGILTIPTIQLNGTVLGGGDDLFLNGGNTAGSNRVLGSTKHIA